MKEAFIVSAVRTAVGKAPKGSLRNTRPDEMGAAAIKEAVNQVEGLDKLQIDDVIMGCAFPEAYLRRINSRTSLNKGDGGSASFLFRPSMRLRSASVANFRQEASRRSPSCRRCRSARAPVAPSFLSVVGKCRTRSPEPPPPSPFARSPVP